MVVRTIIVCLSAHCYYTVVSMTHCVLPHSLRLYSGKHYCLSFHHCLVVVSIIADQPLNQSLALRALLHPVWGTLACHCDECCLPHSLPSPALCSLV